MYTLLNGSVHSNWCGPRGVLLTAEENQTQWESAIGYFVVVELCVLLSLADVHVIKWLCPLNLVQSTWSTSYCRGKHDSIGACYWLLTSSGVVCRAVIG